MAAYTVVRAPRGVFDPKTDELHHADSLDDAVRLVLECIGEEAGETPAEIEIRQSLERDGFVGYGSERPPGVMVKAVRDGDEDVYLRNVTGGRR